MRYRLEKSGEKASQASSHRVNEGQSLAAIQAMQRKKIGTKTDMIFTVNFAELGTTEAGKNSDVDSQKGLVKIGLKCPKTLKDMLLHLTRRAPSKLRELSTHGFVRAGKYYFIHTPILMTNYALAPIGLFFNF